MAAPTEVESAAFVATPRETGPSSKAFWILGGVALLFVGLIGMWLASFGDSDPAVSADPIALPGVRDSPFGDGIDADGTIVLNVPTAAPPFSLRYVIPTSIRAGEESTLGLFGEGFPEDATVTVADEDVSILSVTVRSAEHIEILIVAGTPRDVLELSVSKPRGLPQRSLSRSDHDGVPNRCRRPEGIPPRRNIRRVFKLLVPQDLRCTPLAWHRDCFNRQPITQNQASDPGASALSGSS